MPAEPFRHSPTRNEKMAGKFEDPNAHIKVRTSVGLGVDLVDQLGHGGLPIGHGGGGLLGVAERRVIRTDNVGDRSGGSKMRAKSRAKRARSERKEESGMVLFRLLRSEYFEAEQGPARLASV